MGGILLHCVIVIITVTLMVPARQVHVLVATSRSVLIALAVDHGLTRDPAGITATLVVSVVVHAASVLKVGANSAT